MAAFPTQALPAALLNAISGRSTILTANQRQAHSIRQAFNRAKQAAGLTRWSPADVLPLETWLSARWQRLLLTGAADRLLLNATQERALWRSVIAADQLLPAAKRTYASADSLAALAASAWRLLHLAQGRSRLQECASTTEGAAFIRWATAFEARLSAEPARGNAEPARGNAEPARLLTPAQLPEALTSILRIDRSTLTSSSLTLVDFDTLPAAYAHLLATLEQTGCKIVHLSTARPATSAALYRAPDDAAELTACAAWARQHLAEAPAARIAVIVPNLADRRPALERVFATALGTAPFAAAPPYEFSLGRPLAEHALPATALALLRWLFAPLPLTTISTLLLSPWLNGGGAQAQAAAEFDAFELRQRDALRHTDALRPELGLTAMIAALNASPRRARLVNLLYRLRSLAEAAAESPATFTACAALFRQALAAAGCEPSAEAGSAAQQLWHGWQSALDELATLDATAAPPTTPQAALRELTRITTSRLFAPQTQDAPVQIMGPLEPGGTRFNALWFLGADDLTWPPTTAANPLLPWRLQNALALPGADRARDRQLYTDLTRRLAATATDVVFSYAAEAADGERRPSPLLPALAAYEFSPPDPAIPLARTLIADQTVLPPLHTESGLRGGARIFELQAACAFRAFAELRAFSTGLDTREMGMNALERGSLVHRTMELFWQKIADQQALRALTTEARHAALDACITTALTRATAAASHSWDHAYLDIQRKRLHQLLAPWLDLEAARPPFAVLQQETALNLVEIGGLRIHSLRVDRIDETTGGLLILDYKTGAAHPKSWLGNRPDKPQLPLYAAIFQAASAGRPEALAGVAFATLRAGKSLGLRGFSDDGRVLADLAPMDHPSFEEQVRDWHRILITLAEAFLAGDAQVRPLNYPKTCEHCGQRILCRLNPATLAGTDEDAPAASEESEADAG